MQGSYNKDGLPRPYYLKPRKPSVYAGATARSFFSTSRRKLSGYLVLLSFIGTLMYFISQDLRATPASYDLTDVVNVNPNFKPPVDSAGAKVVPDTPPPKKPLRGKDSHVKEDSIRNSHNAMANGALENEKMAEAVNAKMAKSPKDTKDAVVVAPKGGAANEGNSVHAEKKNAVASEPEQGRFEDVKLDLTNDLKKKDGSAARDGGKGNLAAESGADLLDKAGSRGKVGSKGENHPGAQADLKADIDVGADINSEAKAKAVSGKEAGSSKDGKAAGGLKPQQRNLALEAPKGGMANEANFVGNDEEILFTGQKPPTAKNNNIHLKH